MKAHMDKITDPDGKKIYERYVEWFLNGINLDVEFDALANASKEALKTTVPLTYASMVVRFTCGVNASGGDFDKEATEMLGPYYLKKTVDGGIKMVDDDKHMQANLKKLADSVDAANFFKKFVNYTATLINLALDVHKLSPASQADLREEMPVNYKMFEEITKLGK